MYEIEEMVEVVLFGCVLGVLFWFMCVLCDIGFDCV